MNRLLRLAFTLLLLAPFAALADEYDRYHPDQWMRRLAFDQYEAGKPAAAIPLFTKAARYADKPSQLALAMMYWHGDGVPQDRVLGYVWADIAAERGYPDFVAVREQYWKELSEAEQTESMKRGEAIEAEYGDKRAKKRLEGLLRQGLSKKTGTRTGSNTASVATAQVDATARANMLAVMSSTGLSNVGPDIPPAQQYKGMMKTFSQVVTAISSRSRVNYYSDQNWKPKAYWAYQDATWNEMQGVVTVLPIKPDSKAD
jgi:hypothetical protein